MRVLEESFKLQERKITLIRSQAERKKSVLKRIEESDRGIIDIVPDIFCYKLLNYLTGAHYSITWNGIVRWYWIPNFPSSYVMSKTSKWLFDYLYYN